MYKLIKPIRVDGQHQLPPQSADQKPVVDFMDKQNWSIDAIQDFVCRNPEQTFNLMPWIPISTLVEMQNQNFLSSVMTQELLHKNLVHSQIRSMRSRDLSEFIKLNDMIGKHYSFAERAIQHAMQDLPNLENYWIKARSILEMAQGRKPNVLHLVSKQQKLPRGQYPMEQHEQGFTIYRGNVTFVVDRKWSSSMFDLLFNSSETMLMDGASREIYCTFYQYQEIAKNEIVLYDVQLPQGESTKFNSFTLSKYRPRFPEHRTCYICKATYPTEVYYKTYWACCMTCGRFNHDQTQLQADMTKIKALVTGCRHKIGLATCLRLLRCGAVVVGTTRFPGLAMVNYQAEPDYHDWQNRLTIIACDFFRMDQVEGLVRYVKTHPGFNCFINNACQTLRGSPWYMDRLKSLEQETQHLLTAPNQDLVLAIQSELNQFKDITDRDMNQVSSWNSTLENVEPTEILEVTIVNQIVPTLLFQQIKPLLQEPKIMIEVTAVEGQFNAVKNNRHPHNNACKAAMNMIVRTLSEEPDLYCYTIDPGYVSGVPQSGMTKFPLEPIDGASRIVQPIIAICNGNPLPKNHVHLKNYRKTEW